MSKHTGPKRIAQQRGEDEFEYWMQRLRLELAMGSARRHLDPLVRLLEVLLSQPPITLLTNVRMAQLEQEKLRVSARGNLRAVSS